MKLTNLCNFEECLYIEETVIGGWKIRPNDMEVALMLAQYTPLMAAGGFECYNNVEVATELAGRCAM